jgi:hypothetical protein
MTRTIKQGKHYCTPFPIPKLGDLEVEQYISFDESCKYNLKTKDQADINKLCGLSYGRHHYNLDRIGWRYLVEEDVFELLTYSYVDGVRIPSISLGKVKANEKFRAKVTTVLNNGKRIVTFKLNDRCVAKEYKVSKVWIKYTLGLYFGGNRTAPHDMVVNYY